EIERGFILTILTRPATFTFVFLAVNVLIFLLMTFSGPGGSENDLVLKAYGAKYNSLINAGEWWRFVTPVFLHIGWIHLLVNMYSLFILGPYVERIYGSAKFVFFWIATGVAGVFASYLASGSGMHSGVIGRFLFRGGDGPSAGASGALFGLIGVLFVFGIKFRHELPEGFKRAFGTGMLPTILINLFIGYTFPFIDNAAHLGGFAAGAVLALFVDYKPPGQKGRVAVFWHALQIAALVAVVVAFGQVARHLGGVRPSLKNSQAQTAATNTLNANVISYVNALNEGQVAFAGAINDGNVELVDRTVAALDAAPRLGQEADKLRDDLKQLLVRARAYAPVNQKERQTAKEAAQGKQLLADMDAWNERYATWIKTEGKNYGITLRDAPAPGGQQQPDAPDAEQSKPTTEKRK
ncbi:MAG TPA: rhomboid family intramembrane serine protease, partial [Pyrinomonadaceae bacterium]|nr:rhomboid family intramembrane serine protease [Pyrinomonadaceae bacterium]